MSESFILFSEDRSSVTLSHPENITGGRLSSIPSKSHAHRLLIAAALSDTPVFLNCPVSSADIDATAACLNAMGADIKNTGSGFNVTPINLAGKDDTGFIKKSKSVLHPGESGSTLRFLLPLLGALGITAELCLEGRLPERPLSPLDSEMRRHGISLSEAGSNPLFISGQLIAGEYCLSGGISSQFITGLLFSLPLLKEDSVLKITGKLESRPYVDITLQVLREFGITVNEALQEPPYSPDQVSTIFTIPGRQRYHAGSSQYTVEADWSNAAFFLAAGALLQNPVTLTGCRLNSAQGDRKILSLLKSFGASVTMKTETDDLSDVTISGGHLHGIDIDASDIPDLVPILAVTAAYAEGTTTIRNIERLRIKESDRVAAIIEMIRGIGGSIEEAADTAIKKEDGSSSYLKITGSPELTGGTVSSHNDHRIAMAAAIASLRTSSPVTILDPLAVRKSYPDFYTDLGTIL